MQATVIDPADVAGLEAALNENKVSSIESGSLVLLDLCLLLEYDRSSFIEIEL